MLSKQISLVIGTGILMIALSLLIIAPILVTRYLLEENIMITATKTTMVIINGDTTRISMNADSITGNSVTSRAQHGVIVQLLNQTYQIYPCFSQTSIPHLLAGGKLLAVDKLNVEIKKRLLSIFTHPYIYSIITKSILLIPKNPVKQFVLCYQITFLLLLFQRFEHPHSMTLLPNLTFF